MTDTAQSEFTAFTKEVEKLTPQYTKFWQDIVDIESPTGDKAGVDRVGQYICDAARKLGWTVEYNRQPVSGDAVCITMMGQAKGRPVVLSGHMDTVHPVGSFGTPPTHIEGDKLFGPGATDCKGGIAAAMLCMHALQNTGFGRRPVLLILQSDEETSSLGSRKGTTKFMAEKARGAVAFLNGEPHFPGTVTIARKGIMRLTFTVKGKSVHAAQSYNGVNAIAEAAHKILEIEAFKDPDGVTCNCGTVRGGTADNVVPDTAIFTVDIRYPDAEAEKRMMDICHGIAAHAHIPGTSCTVEVKSRRETMQLLPETLPLLKCANRIFAADGLPTLEGMKRSGASDASDMATAGIPTLDSLGVRGELIHNTGEFGYLSALPEAARRFGSLVLALPDTILPDPTATI